MKPSVWPWMKADISDTAKLVIFIKVVNVGCDVEEFLDMTNLSTTATAQDIYEHVIRVVK